MKLFPLYVLVFCTAGQNTKINVSEKQQTEAKYLYIRARAYLSQKRYDEAIPLLEEAKKKDPSFVDAYIALGNAYIGKKDTLNAKKNFLEATKVAPKDKRGYEGLGFLYGFYLRKKETGIKWYKLAYKLDPKSTTDLLAIARLYEKINIDSADFYYKKLLGLDPENPEGLKRYLNFLVENKKYGEAQKYAGKAIEKLSNDETVMESAFKVYIQMGEAEKAVQIASNLIAKNPDNYIYYLMRGEAYAALNKYKEALSDYNKAENMNPQSIGVHIRKGILYLDLKNYNRALQEAKKALDLGPKSEDIQSIIYYVIAEAYKEIALTYEKQAKSYEKSKNKEAAREKWKSAAKKWESAKKWYQMIYSLGDTPYRDYSRKMVDYCQKKWKKVQRIILGIEEEPR